MSRPTARGLFEKAEKSLTYWVEGSLIDFTEDLCRVMEEQGVTKEELARRLGTSPAYVTRILRGNASFTLTSMVRVALALGQELHLHLAPRNAMTRWVDEEVPVESPAMIFVAEDGAPTGEKG